MVEENKPNQPPQLPQKDSGGDKLEKKSVTPDQLKKLPNVPPPPPPPGKGNKEQDH